MRTLETTVLHDWKFFFYAFQVATALLVAGSTLTFWIPWQTHFASASSYSSVVQSARLLVLINAHVVMTTLIEPWRPKRRQNVITAIATLLTRLPQGWGSTRKHQFTTAITVMWTESSRAFPESYTTGSCVRAMADNGESKGLITPPTRWVSTQLLCVCVIAW